MSLRDIIEGARQEAEEAQAQRTVTKKEPQAETSDTATSTESSSGFSRRSAARAKPRREAAGSVRSGKPESEMTKEEKRAAREEQRKDEDLMVDAKRAVLESREDYRRMQRIWWIAVIAGLGCSVGSWLFMRYLQESGNGDMSTASISIALMVIAYVLVIGAFIFDIVKVRPMRKEADTKVLGMSKRRMKQVVAEEADRKAAKKAKK